MAEVKVTKKDYFVQLKDIVETSDLENKEELLTFLNKQVELLESKAEKAKERNAKKKAEGDKLRDKIASLLTNEVQTADDILAQIEDEEDITKAKVVARLSQLVKVGIAEKEQVKIDSYKRMAYKLAEGVEIEVVEDDVEEECTDEEC